MLIEPVNIQEQQYSELVSACGTVFNSVKWLEMYENSLSTYGIFNDNKELIGAFNYYTVNRFGIKIIKTPPFSPHIGLIFMNPAQQAHQRNTFVKKINQCVAEFLLRQHAAIYFLALPAYITDTQSFHWLKFNVSPNYTYQLNLNLSENELSGLMSDKKRNSIKKALKDNVLIEQVSDYTEIKKIAGQTYLRKSKKLNETILNAILNKFAHTGNCFALVARLNNKVTAMSFCIYDTTTAYYLLGGYNPENKHNGSGALVLYSSILHAKKAGLTCFDFEGSMLPEVEENFREFGGDLTPYQTLSKAGNLYKLPLKLIKPQLF